MNEADCTKILTELDAVVEDAFKFYNSDGEITIIEPEDVAGNCKKVTIFTNKETFTLSLDIKKKPPFNIFKTKKGYNKKNDCILYCFHNQKLLILLIELKSINAGDYLKQLKAGKNFSTYLINQINTFSDLDISKDDILYRGILFKTYRTSPSKGTTKRNKIFFKDRNGLDCGTLTCNNKYYLQYIKDSI